MADERLTSSGPTTTNTAAATGSKLVDIEWNIGGGQFGRTSSVRFLQKCISHCCTFDTKVEEDFYISMLRVYN